MEIGWGGVKWITLCMHEYITPAAVCFPWQGSGVRLPALAPALSLSPANNKAI